MTLSPGGELVPRGCVSDLYRNYTLQSCGSRVSATSDATATAAVVAAATTTGALLVPLPPASSSFTTLDGVPRGKCAYFIRHNVDVPLTASNFHSSVLYGDFPVHSKMETMSLLFDEVLQPLLDKAQGVWPSPVRKDLQARVKEVRNTLTEVGPRLLSRHINLIECSEESRDAARRESLPLFQCIWLNWAKFSCVYKRYLYFIVIPHRLRAKPTIAQFYRY